MRTALILAALVLLGCSSGTDPSDDVASVRMLNAVTDGPGMVFLVDGQQVGNRIGPGTATDYATARTNGVLEVRHAISNAILLTDTLDLAADGAYTLLFTGSLSDMVLMVESDTQSRPAPGTAKLRVIHVAPEAAPIDLYVTEPGTPDPVPWLQPFNYRTTTSYRQGQPGTYVVSTLLAGTAELSNTHTVELLDGRAKTLVLVDGTGVHVAFLELSDFL